MGWWLIDGGSSRRWCVVGTTTRFAVTTAIDTCCSWSVTRQEPPDQTPITLLLRGAIVNRTNYC